MKKRLFPRKRVLNIHMITGCTLPAAIEYLQRVSEEVPPIARLTLILYDDDDGYGETEKEISLMWDEEETDEAFEARKLKAESEAIRRKAAAKRTAEAKLAKERELYLKLKQKFEGDPR
jgi:hypothetical protein